MKRISVSTLLLVILSHCLYSQQALRQDIVNVISDFNGDVGVAVKHIENGDSLSINGNRHFPMQSVFKFHLALAVLNLVDQGKLSIDQKIRVEKSDLLPNTWSPIAKKYPEGNVELRIGELLSYTVSQSDNSGCDILFKLIGGPKKVEWFIHGLGVKDVAIGYTEEEMHQSWDAQFKNWCAPTAMAQLLELFGQKKVLAETTHELLMKFMIETNTGKNRIKGLLPTGTIVAHKTGTSGRSPQGVSGAVNDVGIITLPNGKHIAVALFISNTKEDTEKQEALIAKISQLAFDYYTRKN
jgi:beta-lactamase class A